MQELVRDWEANSEDDRDTSSLAFISRHRRMRNHCESATSVCINITKPLRREVEKKRQKERPEPLKSTKSPNGGADWTNPPLFLSYHFFFFHLLSCSFTHTHIHTGCRQWEQMSRSHLKKILPNLSIISPLSQSCQYNRQDRITGESLSCF